MEGAPWHPFPPDLILAQFFWLLIFNLDLLGGLSVQPENKNVKNGRDGEEETS